MNNKLLDLYFREELEWINKLVNTKALNRLNGIGMNCGVEYTSFPFYQNLGNYNRLEHSIGVAKIIYYFTLDKKMSISGLFHDISTGPFSHVIDFVFNDYLKQEKSEIKTSDIISSDKEVMKYLNDNNILISEVDDYHLYPIADNPTPMLSSDRLEYTLNNFINFGYLSLNEVKTIYQDLIVGINEYNQKEIMFKSLDACKLFTLQAIKNSYVYVSDEDRYSMEYLANIIKYAIKNKVINKDDIFNITEKKTIEKFKNNDILNNMFNGFTKLNKLVKTNEKINSYSYKIFSKKRYIDPYVINKGRISNLDSNIKDKINEFKNLSFDYYLTKVD